MSTLPLSRARRAAGRVTWVEVEPGFHVASRSGEFVGHVDTTRTGAFISFDGRATPVGRFDTLAAAKSSLRTAVSPPPVTRRSRIRRVRGS